MSSIQLKINALHPYENNVTLKFEPAFCPNCHSDRLSLNEQDEILCQDCHEICEFKPDQKAKLFARLVLDLPFEKRENKKIEKAIHLLEKLEEKTPAHKEMLALLYDSLANALQEEKHFQKAGRLYRKALQILEETHSAQASQAGQYFMAYLYLQLGHCRMVAGDKLAMASLLSAQKLIKPLYQKARNQSLLVFGHLYEKVLISMVFLSIIASDLKKAYASQKELLYLIDQQKESYPELYRWDKDVLANSQNLLFLEYENGDPKKALSLAKEMIEACEKEFLAHQDLEHFELLLYQPVYASKEAGDHDQMDEMKDFLDQSDDWIKQAKEFDLDLHANRRMENLLLLHALQKATWLFSAYREEESLELLETKAKELEEMGEIKEFQLLSLAEELYGQLAWSFNEMKRVEEALPWLEKQREIFNQIKERREQKAIKDTSLEQREFELLVNLCQSYQDNNLPRKEFETIEDLIALTEGIARVNHFPLKEAREMYEDAANLARELGLKEKYRYYKNILRQIGS